MIENRELNIDDYLVMIRRRLKVILIPTLLAPFLGFAISYLFPPKYSSQSLVMVDQQKVPEGYVKSVVTEDLTQRIATMQQQVLSRKQLQPMIERLGLAKNGKSVDEVIDDIRRNVSLEAVQPDIMASKKPRRQGNDDVPGFYVTFIGEDPRDTQQVCSEITSMLLAENLRLREQVAQGTTDFLARQVEDAKDKLNELDGQLAIFKKQYMGQLPEDADNNMKVLQTLQSQLDADTQALNRAQQDKAYTESLLSQQLEAWKATQSATNPQTLDQQLAALQSQLITLQARYTDDYPDVIKVKNDIAEVKKQIVQMNAAATKQPAPTDKAALGEPAAIQQLRLQVHQFNDNIAQLGRHQKKLQEQLSVYQGRVSLSPTVEERYKALTRDYETAQKFYNDLLTKKSESEMATDMERRQQGQQMRLLNPASFPDTPSFPVRWQFAAGGLGGGFAIGVGLALWLELRDKSIHTEQDVLAVLELPMLVSVPWLGPDNQENGDRRKRKDETTTEEKKETVGV